VFERRLRDSLDLVTIALVLGLTAIGILAIASATLDHGYLSGLWRMQSLWLAIAFSAGAVVVIVDYHKWAELAVAAQALVILLLVAVFFFGKEVAGNKSWLVLGPATLQPSELAKWTTCLALAVYLVERVRGGMGLQQCLEMGILVAIPMGLVALQPDMGTALTFLPIYIGGLLLGGVRWRVLVIAFLAVALLAPLAWPMLKDYQRERILTILDPERDPSGIGYQVRQSKIAIGAGGITGKGLFQGTQSQLDFLPAQHTDFILAVIAEELGFLGAAGVLIVFYLLLYRGIVAARSAQDRLGTYLCLMVVAWFTGQVTINVGMVLGLLPTIGVPLPFVSYGGSALVAAVCGAALIVNVRTRRFVN
jgi:rod shape determining protein RodA